MRKSLVMLLLTGNALSAQAPARYRYITTSPNMQSTFDGGATARTISVNKATGVVKMTTRDTAGGKLFEIIEDSMLGGTELTDTTAEAKARYEQARANRPASNPTIRPAIRHQILVQNGIPTSSVTTYGTGLTRPDTINVGNPYLSLLTRANGLGLLVPGPKFPATVGEVRADTFFSHSVQTITMTMAGSGTPITPPPTTVDDSTVVLWKRVSADTIEGTVTKRISRSSETTIGDAKVSGLFRIVYDARHEVREATMQINTISTSVAVSGARPPSTTTSSSSWSLTRLP